jgi:hypothetical protein
VPETNSAAIKLFTDITKESYCRLEEIWQSLISALIADHLKTKLAVTCCQQQILLLDCSDRTRLRPTDAQMRRVDNRATFFGNAGPCYVNFQMDSTQKWTSHCQHSRHHSIDFISRNKTQYTSLIIIIIIIIISGPTALGRLTQHVSWSY